MDLMKEMLGPSEPKVEPKPAPKVESKPASKVEPKPASKVESKPKPKVEPKTIVKAQPVDNEKLQRLEQEYSQAESDYLASVQEVMHAYSFYDQMKRGYDRDPENSSKKAVDDAAAELSDCRSHQSEINRKRNSLKKQIAELKGGANSQ